MKKSEYLRRAFEAYNEGRISEEAYDAMIMNAAEFCEDDEDDLPDFTDPQMAAWEMD